MRASILDLGSVLFSTLGLLAIAIVLLSGVGTATADEPLTGGNGCGCDGSYSCQYWNGNCYGDDCTAYCDCNAASIDCI